MRGKLRGKLTYANVMVTILAVLVIGGSGAYAAKKLKLKNNSVTTKKIRDGAVQTPDLGDAAVTAAKLADGAVTGAKVQDGSIGPADVADSLLGNRSVGRMDNSPGTCSPVASGTNCVDVVLPLPRAGRVFVSANGGAQFTANSLVIGACDLTADGAQISFGAPLAGNGTVDGTGHTEGTDHFSLTGVSAPLPAGNHTFALRCSETSTELSILDSQLSAVSLSAD